LVDFAVLASNEDLLRAGIKELGLDLSDHQIRLLLEYLSLFELWNRTYNLSAIREPSDMVRLHLLDSLTIAPYLIGARFIDVGTGGGLPGIPLAIVFPERHFTLLDSAGKKTRFLFQVKQQLRLNNVAIENSRVEAYRPVQGYDGVISRAFASLQDMTNNCGHLFNQDGRFWAMKGVMPEDELRQITENHSIEHCYPLRIPGVEAQRCLLVLKRNSDDSKR
jgi:16S rRNA (guanine527-N7)-methyltransferase